MAWMRMMGADSVDYHRDTVLDRGDDHPGQALDYYASRGETPLVWGGSGAPELGLAGAVSEAEYDAIYGPGGACDPLTGRPSGGRAAARDGAGGGRPQVASRCWV